MSIGLVVVCRLGRVFNPPSSWQVTDDTIGPTVEMLAREAEQSATNVTQQTTETLTEIDGGLTSVADFVSGPNTSVITDTVSKNIVCLLPLMYYVCVIGCEECCGHYQFTTPLVTGFCYDLQQFTVGDLLNVNSTIH